MKTVAVLVGGMLSTTHIGRLLPSVTRDGLGPSMEAVGPVETEKNSPQMNFHFLFSSMNFPSVTKLRKEI